MRYWYFFPGLLDSVVNAPQFELLETCSADTLLFAVRTGSYRLIPRFGLGSTGILSHN